MNTGRRGAWWRKMLCWIGGHYWTYEFKSARRRKCLHCEAMQSLDRGNNWSDSYYRGER